MRKYGKYIVLFTLIFVVSCANKEIADYKDNDIAAIVRGEEITVGELRILYTDEKVLDMINGTIKAKLVEQEAKQMNLDVTDEIEQEIEAKMKSLLDDTESSSWESIRGFAEIQSVKLDITEEAFYEKYVELTTVQNTYMSAYVEELVDKQGDELEDIKAYNKKVNELLDDLVTTNKAEIKILIK